MKLKYVFFALLLALGFALLPGLGEGSFAPGAGDGGPSLVLRGIGEGALSLAVGDGVPAIAGLGENSLLPGIGEVGLA